MGVSADFAHKANLAPPDDMWFPSVAELITEHVATRVVNSLDFALSDIDVAGLTHEGIRRQRLDDPRYAQIRKYFPDHYARIVDASEDALKRGASGTELLEALKAPVTSAFFAMLPYAPDEDVLAVMRFFVTNASKIRTRDRPIAITRAARGSRQSNGRPAEAKISEPGGRRMGNAAADH